MPHLFLHMRHGETFVEDSEGAYCTYLEDARREALWAARELMSQRVLQGRSAANSTFEITDGAGNVLLICPFGDAVDSTEH